MQQSIFDSVPMAWPQAPRPGVITMRAYQDQAKLKIIKDYEARKSLRQLVIMATGLGKTPTMGAIALWCLTVLKKPVMMVAHREELLEQAAEEIAAVIGPDYIIEIEQADREASQQAHVVLASVQTIGRSNSNRITKFSPDHFGVIMFDEAHHCIASTYQYVISYFNPEKTGTLIVGVTATPKRADDESLSGIFDSVALNLDIVAGTRQKYLAPIVSWRVDSKTDLARVRTTAGDFNLKDLAAAVNNVERNTLIVETWQKRFPDKQALIFATDLEHVFRLTEQFQSIGVSAEGISGDMPKEERRKIIADFKSGKLKILANFGILTEGFNYGKLDLIINARPTKSQLLLTQIAGRSTRLWEGKDVAHIVEIVDEHSDKTATVAKIFNFRQDFDCEGHDFLECVNLADTMIGEKEYFNPYNCASWSEMKLRFERANPTNTKGLAPGEKPRFAPGDVKEVADDIYSTFDDNSDYFDSRYRYFRSGTNLKLIHSDKDSGMRYQVVITPNGLGGFDSIMMRKPLAAPRTFPGERIIAFRGANGPDAAKKIEDHMLTQYPDWDRLLWIKAPWKKRAKGERCSEKQYALIKKFKLSNVPMEQISKYDASNLLGAYFSKDKN